MGRTRLDAGPALAAALASLEGVTARPELVGQRAEHYRGIVIDPPWKLVGGTAVSKAYGPGKRGADRHYPVLPTKEIPGVILGSGEFRPAPDSHLYLWVINNFLPDGLWVMGQLGFRYVTMVTWCKTGRSGQGVYFRGRTEHMLFGVRGRGKDVRTAARNLPTSFSAPVGAHSEKPEEAYRLVEARTPGPHLDMFGRTPRPGWAVWGHVGRVS